MIVITRTKTEAEGSVKYECPERNDSLGKETKQPNLQKEERSDKSLRVVVVTKKGWVVNQINQTYFLKGLRMKKSVCLMAILGALGATSAFAAQSVIIDFTGEVRDTACNVSLVDNSKALDLGHIMASAKAAEASGKGEAIPVVFKLTNCGLGAPDKAPVINLAQDLTITDTALKNSDVTQGTLGTNHENVVVQFGDQSKKDQKPSSTPVVSAPDGNSFFIQYGYAYLKALNDAPAAQKVNAKALFTVTYQ